MEKYDSDKVPTVLCCGLTSPVILETAFNLTAGRFLCWANMRKIILEHQELILYLLMFKNNFPQLSTYLLIITPLQIYRTYLAEESLTDLAEQWTIPLLSRTPVEILTASGKL